MPSVIAIRGQGDAPAPDITDPLVTTRPAALERARVELDSGELQTPVRIQCRFQPDARPGLLATVQDAAQGKTWIGTITAVEHVSVAGGAISTLTILKPDPDE